MSFARKLHLPRRWKWCILALWALTAVACSCSIVPQWKPAKTDLGAARVELPMELIDGQICIRQRDAHGVYLVMIDSGCRDVILSPQLARSLNANSHLVFPTITTDSGGISRWFWTANRIKEFRIGPARFADFDADVLPLEDQGKTAAGTPIGAIVGMNLFHDCLLTIDYPNMRLVIERGQLPPANADTILPLREPNLTGDRGIAVEVQFGGLGGRRAWAKIDTGFIGQLTVSRDVADSVPITAKREEPYVLSSLFGPGQPHQRANYTGVLMLGRFAFPELLVVIDGPANPRRNHILIGSEILSNFRITIDQKNLRIRLLRPGDEIPAPAVDR